MNKQKFINEWLKVNIELNKYLELLKGLDSERQLIIQNVKSQGETAELQQQMQKSHEYYQVLSLAMKKLKQKSSDLKEKLAEILTEKEMAELLKKTDQ